jgi:hypothetical protein
MPLLKRVLLFFAELSIPIFGVALALALVYRFGSEEGDRLVVGFFVILVVSVITFILFRRKSQAWKMNLMPPASCVGVLYKGTPTPSAN